MEEAADGPFRDGARKITQPYKSMLNVIELYNEKEAKAYSRTGNPERLPHRPSKSGPSDPIMPIEQRRKASRDLPSIRIWSTRAHSRRPSSAPRCRPVRRNRRPCR